MSNYYKLVPVGPTQEMIEAGVHANFGATIYDTVAAIYRAMLAAAPDFDRQVIAEVNENDDGYWADILPDRYVYLGQPLYAVMQPPPDVAELVTALRVMIHHAKHVRVCGNFSSAVIMRAIDALAAYRKQGGDV